MSNINIANVALGFVIAAQYIFTGSKRGEERKTWVIKQLYSQLPSDITATLTEDEFSTVTEGAVSTMKTLLQAVAD